MQNINLDHPTEDELELFVLRQSEEQELEQIETHILACETCVTRLEKLEFEISAMKLSLREMQKEQLAKAAVKQGNRWTIRFPVPNFSLVGAVAAVALGIIIVPAFLQRGGPVAKVSLSTYRGTEASTVPEGRRLQMHLNASGLAEGNVIVNIVDERGAEVWKGRAAIHNEQLEALIPPITARGTHFLRLYTPTDTRADSDLLREFAFQVE
jgi:hypothetical protein